MTPKARKIVSSSTVCVVEKSNSGIQNENNIIVQKQVP
jgi:hypothetical protein